MQGGAGRAARAAPAVRRRAGARVRASSSPCARPCFKYLLMKRTYGHTRASHVPMALRAGTRKGIARSEHVWLPPGGMRNPQPLHLVVQFLLVQAQLLQVGGLADAAKQTFPRREVYPQADPEICVVLISADTLQ